MMMSVPIMEFGEGVSDYSENVHGKSMPGMFQYLFYFK